MKCEDVEEMDTSTQYSLIMKRPLQKKCSKIIPDRRNKSVKVSLLLRLWKDNTTSWSLLTRKLWMQNVHKESNDDYANSQCVEGAEGLEWEQFWISIRFIISNQGSRCAFNYTQGVSDSLSLLPNIIYTGDPSPLISHFSSDSARLSGFHLTKPPFNVLSVWHQKPTCAPVQCAQINGRHSWKEVLKAILSKHSE